MSVLFALGWNGEIVYENRERRNEISTERLVLVHQCVHKLKSDSVAIAKWMATLT